MKNYLFTLLLGLCIMLFAADVKAQQAKETPKLATSAKKVETLSSKTNENKEAPQLSLGQAKKNTELLKQKKNPGSKPKESAPKLATMSKKEEK